MKAMWTPKDKRVWTKKTSEYDQEMPQIQANPEALWWRDAELRQPHDSKKTINEKQPALSSSRKDTKNYITKQAPNT